MKPNLEAFYAAVNAANIDQSIITAHYSDLNPSTELYASSNLFPTDLELGDELRSPNGDYHESLPSLFVVSVDAAANSHLDQCDQFMRGKPFSVNAITIMHNDFQYKDEGLRLSHGELLTYGGSNHEFVCHSKYDDTPFKLDLSKPLDHEWGQVFDVLLSDEVDHTLIEHLMEAATAGLELTHDDGMQP